MYQSVNGQVQDVIRRLGTSLANHRASLSSELGSLWDFIRTDKDRRRSNPTSYEPIQSDAKSPVRLARDLLQVIQETVFSKRYDEPKKCPLVKEESDLSSDEEEGTDSRIANLIDFFFTIVKSQRDDRKGSGSCFRPEPSPADDTICVPIKVNTELEHKMETLIEFLATSGCTEKEDAKDENKITLMEFLFGPEDRLPIDAKESTSVNESTVSAKNLCFIDETPEEEQESLVNLLMKYMEDYNSKDKLKDLKVDTPSLSEKSKSDVTISKMETFSDISKTKSDSTLTHTQETVIDRRETNSDKSSGRISETVIDLSHIKEDLKSIFDEAISKVKDLEEDSDDVMSESEDLENFNMYTQPALLQYMPSLPYSVELSDILEEDEPSSNRKLSEDQYIQNSVQQCAEELILYIEDKVEKHFDDSSSDEFDISSSLKRNSISLIDLRSIPDLPPSMIIKPKVKRVDKSTSTTEISDSLSDLSRRIDSACMTEDTTLTTSSERSERALDKLESLHRFFSRSRLEIIDESIEEHCEKVNTKEADTSKSNTAEYKAGQASLDDVEDLLDDNEVDKTEVEDIQNGDNINSITNRSREAKCDLKYKKEENTKSNDFSRFDNTENITKLHMNNTQNFANLSSEFDESDELEKNTREFKDNILYVDSQDIKNNVADIKIKKKIYLKDTKIVNVHSEINESKEEADITSNIKNINNFDVKASCSKDIIEENKYQPESDSKQLKGINRAHSETKLVIKTLKLSKSEIKLSDDFKMTDIDKALSQDEFKFYEREENFNKEIAESDLELTTRYKESTNSLELNRAAYKFDASIFSLDEIVNVDSKLNEKVLDLDEKVSNSDENISNVDESISNSDKIIFYENITSLDESVDVEQNITKIPENLLNLGEVSNLLEDNILKLDDISNLAEDDQELNKKINVKETNV